jgi:hypothetical protein
MGLRILQLRRCHLWAGRSLAHLRTNYVIHTMCIGTSILYNAPTSASRYDLLVRMRLEGAIAIASLCFSANEGASKPDNGIRHHLVQSHIHASRAGSVHDGARPHRSGVCSAALWERVRNDVVVHRIDLSGRI